ncbi:hypothetical protein FRC01_003625, partial [Tulasnella sp. 417]
MEPFKPILTNEGLSKTSLASEDWLDPNQAESTTQNHLCASDEEKRALECFIRNQKLPVNSLPPELLHAVVRHVGGFYLGQYTQLLGLRVVCKYWKDVIDSTPELWMAIKTQLHPELQAMIIRNSRNQRLSVWYDETVRKNDPAGEVKMATFSSLVEPLASRWEWLTYLQDPRSESASRILSLPLHHLRRIDVLRLGWPGRQHPFDAPQLSYVNINRFSLNWRSLSGLQVLILKATNIALNELMAVLHASPDLRDLSLQQLGLEVRSADALTSSKIILPHLSSLKFYRNPTQQICLLLDSMETSSLQTFVVAEPYRIESEICNSLCKSAARYIGAFPPPRGDEEARIWILASMRDFNFGLGERKIIIRNYRLGHGNGPQNRLSYLTSVVECLDSRMCREMKILELCCREHDEIGDYLRTIHSHFPQIDQLLLESNGFGIIAAVQHLDSPLQSDSTGGWLLPKLTKLKLDLRDSTDAGLVDAVAQLVVKRKAAEGVEEITGLSITSSPGGISLGMVEFFRQSVASFELTEK